MPQSSGARAEIDSRITGGPLAYLIEQLWQPALDTGDVRVALGDDDDPGWVDLERYRVLPGVDRARMLFPDAPKDASVGSLLNFRGLRRRTTNVQRTVLGSLARAGRLPFPVLRLQTRAEGPAAVTPLAAVGEVLGRDDLAASVAVNTSANRKATLQVVDENGVPAGFAKFAWDEVSTASVQAEGEALLAVGDRAGTVRAPALLASGSYYDKPFIVSQPLPLDSVGVRADVPPPSALELYTLLPLTRRARIGATGQCVALTARLEQLAAAGPEILPVVGAALALLALVGTDEHEVAVQERCHGDLAAWNTARASDGTLWLWDWESSEPDAAAGLDALHWHMSARTEAGERWDGPALLTAIELARPLLAAAGTSRRAEPLVAALYAATIAERACTLAAGPGGWEAGWVLPEHLLEMLATAERLLVEASRG